VLAGYQLGARWGNVGRYSDLLNLTVWVVLALTVVRFLLTRLRRRKGAR
jgi:membrane protein DedA with SNARE-associated domain